MPMVWCFRHSLRLSHYRAAETGQREPDSLEGTSGDLENGNWQEEAIDDFIRSWSRVCSRVTRTFLAESPSRASHDKIAV